jgi:eukaryotic-like serine/threonine-protein kinase
MRPAAHLVESILAAAVEIGSEADRRRYVEEACAGDPALRRRVEELIENHFRAGSFLESPAVSWPATTDEMASAEAGRPPDTVIGPYKLLEPIGEGGFGVVYMAEQAQPVRRKVALKVLKPGMDTKQVVARFEAERQALALMDHPHIARVFDGGQAPSGRPYFVMELVRGVPITTFCDQNHLGVRERLELFIPVCQGVQHAHTKGVIHRDIKPSNVLVTLHDGVPVPKVIDFGIAKATGQQLTEKTLFTGFAQMVGTPLYMSPEQAEMSGLDVDTGSDVYALGVLLYELLTGTTPFDKERLRQAGFDEMRRIIREEEPPRPSTRLSTVGQAATTASEKRRSDPRRLSRMFRGELDWVVMKALEKDRNRRYDSASAFAQDVRRYLHDEPVLACPPSVSYRARKFLRRNRGPALAAGVCLLLLVAGIVGTTAGLVRALAAERETNEALTQVTAEKAKTQSALTGTREALDALTDGVVETMFAKQPELGEAEKAFLRKVLGFYEAFTRQSGETAEARFLRAKGFFKVAYLRDLLGQRHEAEAGYRRAEALLGELAGEFPDEPEYPHKLARTQGNLGTVLWELGKEAEAETALRRTLDLRAGLVKQFPRAGEYRSELARTYHDLGFLLEGQEKYADAEKAYGQALKLEEKLVTESRGLVPYRQGLARTRSVLGGLLRKQKRYAEAEKEYHEALKVQERLVEEAPVPRVRRNLADSYHGLGIVLAGLGKGPEAEKAFEQAVALGKKLAEDFPNVLAYHHELANDYGDLGFFLRGQGKHADAEKAYRRALGLREKVVAKAGTVPRYRQDLGRTYVGLGEVLGDQKKPEEAEKAFRQALPHQTRLVNEFPRAPAYRNHLVDTLAKLCLLRMQRREFADALPLLEQAGSHLQAALEASPKDPTARRFRRDHLRVTAQCYAGLADHARLAATADELARFGYDPMNDNYLAACMLCSCVVLAEKDAQLAEVRRKELARGYADRALALLRQAVAHGYQDVARLREDPNLQPVRAREEFRKLLDEMEGKTKE